MDVGRNGYQSSLVDQFGQPLSSDRFLAEVAVPHADTFISKYNADGRQIYRWTFDEALKRNRENGLAMRRNAVLMGMLEERYRAAKKLKWHIVPEDEEDETQQFLAKRVERGIRAIPHFGRIKDALIEAVWWGRAGCQVIWNYRTIAGKKTAIPTQNWPVNGDKIGFKFDGTPYVSIFAQNRQMYEQKGFEVFATDGGHVVLVLDRPFLRDRFLIHKHRLSDADYLEGELAGGIHGVGLRHLLYWIDWVIQEMWSWQLKFMQRAGLGLTVVVYESGNAAAQTAATNTAKMINEDGSVVIMPMVPGIKSDIAIGVHRLETPTAGVEFLQKTIEYYHRVEERIIVGQSTSSGNKKGGSGLGNEADAEFQQDTKADITLEDAERLQESLTTDLLGPYLRYNEPQIDFPLYFRFAIDKPQPEKLLEAVTKAAGLGVEFKETEVRELTGMSEPKEGDKTVGGVQEGEDEDGVANEEDAGKSKADVRASGRTPASDPENKPERYQRAALPLLYAKEDSGGHWITIGAKAGDGGEKHGGSPVFVQNGRIVKGHPSLTGRPVSGFTHAEDAEDGKQAIGEDESTHRQQLQQSRDYARAMHGKRAKAEGVDPKDLHMLAAEIVEHDKAFKGERTKILQSARETYRKLGYGNLQGLNLKTAKGADQDAFRGLDDVAQIMSKKFPDESLWGDDPTAKLFDLLTEGNPEPMSEDEAYAQAAEHLRGLAKAEGEREPGDEEEPPKKKPTKTKKPQAASDPMADHPFAGKSRERMIDELDKLSGYQSSSAADAYHAKLDKVSEPNDAGLENAVLQAASEHGQANPYSHLQMDELFKKLSTSHPGLTAAQQQVLLRRLVRERKIRLHPYTGPIGKHPSPEHSLPMGQEHKFYIEAITKPQGMVPFSRDDDALLYSRSPAELLADVPAEATGGFHAPLLAAVNGIDALDRATSDRAARLSLALAAKLAKQPAVAEKLRLLAARCLLPGASVRADS